ncbi:hypothetical protein SK128_023782, partial [Halocaridina rubra]
MQDQQQGKQRKDQQKGGHSYAASMRYYDSCRSSRRKNSSGSVPEGAVVSSLSSVGAVAGSQRDGQQVLYFPATTRMDFHQMGCET